MSKSILGIIVNKAVSLLKPFKVNGKSTDGTINVNIEAIKSLTNLSLTPSQVATFSAANVEGLSTFIVDAKNLLPSLFTVTHLANLLIMDNRDPAQVDKITALMISRVDGRVYSLRADRNASTWTLDSISATMDDLTGIVSTGVNKLTSPFSITLNGDGSGSGTTNGATTANINVTLADMFQGLVTASTVDPDVTLKPLILTRHANCPLPSVDWYVQTYRTTTGRGQMATSASGTIPLVAYRHSINGVFQGSGWVWLSNNKLTAGDIPNLDSAKINSGTLGADRIPYLDAAKINGGIFNVARIPALDAGKITSGEFDLARIPNISAAKIPALDAAKITTGSFDEERIPVLTVAKIPALAASKITSGTFDDARIPALNAGKINAGIFDALRIPSLDASKINSGIFAVERLPTFTAAMIPALDTSKVTSGVFADARIPSMSASKINAGVFAVERIPSMSASKINSGVFAAERIPTLPSSKISGIANGAASQIYVGTAAPDNSLGKDLDVYYQLT